MKTVVYTVDTVTLDGSVEKDASPAASSHVYDYQFVMDDGAKNVWQGKAVDVKIEAFAKQHRNTTSLDASDWTGIVEK